MEEKSKKRRWKDSERGKKNREERCIGVIENEERQEINKRKQRREQRKRTILSWKERKERIRGL